MDQLPDALFRMKSSPTSTKAHREGRGFTLVELLVVIAIISVLVVLGFTVTSRIKDRAVTATDTGKFRQVGALLADVVQENNGIIPHGNLTKDPATGDFLYPKAAIPGTGNRWTFHELLDRGLSPHPDFNFASIYNYQLRHDSDSIFCSKVARPWKGYNPGASYKLPGPLWFSFNRNLPNPRWVGRMSRVPDPSRIVICGETNHLGGDMRPQQDATFSNNVETRYRVSRAGNTALYLFLDGHVERLKGHRGESYYAANPGESNIWKWW